MKIRILIVALVALVALAALAVPAPVWAHARLVRTDPANGAVLARPPATVRVVFDDRVTVGGGNAAVRNGGGSILRGVPRLDAGGRILVLPLAPRLPNGDYTARWTIVSDDGHAESGVVAFGVGLGRPPPVATLAPRSVAVSPVRVTGRWLLFAGILGAAGISIFALVARPRDDERLALVLSSAAVLAALGAADVAGSVGLGTRSGAVLGAGFVLAIVVATGAAAATLDRRALRPALFASLGLVLVPPFAGHAFDRSISRVNVPVDALHVAAAATWVGVLVGLAVLRGAELRRAARLAAAAIVVLGATGIVRAVYELGPWSQLWSIGYGRALLVKSGLVVAALAAGWLLRARLRRRLAAELVLVAGVLVAVAFLVDSRPGRSYPQANCLSVDTRAVLRAPPAPPPAALVVAKQFCSLGVAIAAEPKRTTAIVLSPAGGGLGGLAVELQGYATTSCGAGCYTAPVAPGRHVEVTIDGQALAFDLPLRAPSAAAILRRARERYLALRSVVYVERLASDERVALVSQWRLERPDRLTYSIDGGAEAVVIGKRRWDRANRGAPWVASPQTPLPQPSALWASASNVRALVLTPQTVTLSFVDMTIPAFFTATLDRQTLLPRVVEMTAASHFMIDRYVAFNEPPQIRPPR